MSRTTPRVLYYDIETSLQPVAVFSLLHNDFISPDSIIQERYIISAAWQWEGESKVHCVSVLDDKKRYRKDPHDDLHVVKTLHKVLSEADVIIGHNSDHFDKRWIDTRILVHGLSPLPPISSVDTYKIARSRFYLNSNKLDYIGKLLKVGRKIPTTPGLWMRVLNGDAAAVKEMVKYNCEDVKLLRRIYDKLKPYAQIPSLELFGQREGCPRCGSKNVQSRGLHRALTKVYRRWCCSDCGGWHRTLRATPNTSTPNRTL